MLSTQGWVLPNQAKAKKSVLKCFFNVFQQFLQEVPLFPNENLAGISEQPPENHNHSDVDVDDGDGDVDVDDADSFDSIFDADTDIMYEDQEVPYLYSERDVGNQRDFEEPGDYDLPRAYVLA